MDSTLVIFVCSGLFVYWMARVWLLLKGSADQIDKALELDLWWLRRIVAALREIIQPPPTIST
jgi:hypothetical protein